MAVSSDKTRAIISLEKDLKAKLEELANNEDRSFSNYVVKVLKEHIQSMEGDDKEQPYLSNQVVSNDYSNEIVVTGSQPANTYVLANGR